MKRFMLCATRDLFLAGPHSILLPSMVLAISYLLKTMKKKMPPAHLCEDARDVCGRSGSLGSQV